MLNSLMKHMEWADALMWDAVLKKPEPDERLHRLLYHLHMTQRAFLQVWQHKVSLDLPAESSFKEYAAIRQWARSYYSPARELVARTDPAQLGRELKMPWADQYAKKFGVKAGPATFEESVVQIAMHTGHHRGQVNMRVKDLGGDPPPVDYVIWVWIGKPEPVWDAAAVSTP
jgi:uncharacterized damage-inducible protein DinB